MGLLDQTVHAFKMLDIAKNLLKSRYLFTYPPAGNQKLPALLKTFSSSKNRKGNYIRPKR